MPYLQTLDAIVTDIIAPAAPSTDSRFARACSVSGPIPPGARSPVCGSSPACAEQKTSDSIAMAWLYGPTGRGASALVTTVRTAILLLPPVEPPGGATSRSERR